MSTAKLYRTFEVWRKQDDLTAVRYLCLEDLDTEQFWVKSADHVRHPLDRAVMTAQYLQAAELVLDSLIFEESEDDVRRWSSSIPRAIELFDREFES